MNASPTHIVARSHPAEYLIHKYWSRKPHNVLRDLFSTRLHEGSVFVDPFAGSGVPVSEACRCGAIAFACDINPVAALLTSVTTDPPPARDAAAAIDRLVESSKDRFSHLYKVSGAEIRYAVHSVVTTCRSCNRELQATTALKEGQRAYRCAGCGGRAFFNLEGLKRTAVIEVVMTDGRRYRRGTSDESDGICDAEERRSSIDPPDLTLSTADFDVQLVPNRRILAFPGMRVSDLFTRRAFSVASSLFTDAEAIDDARLRRACQVFLTSVVAQLSRLIPYRNGLSTGGPAWSVPGFWVAPIHLETNPFVHLRARKLKYVRGIEALCDAAADFPNRPEVRCADAGTFLAGLRSRDVKADLVFLDPPYGDSVPYLEFSAIWNAMLKKRPDYSRELVVSDRQIDKAGMHDYERGMSSAVRECARLLADDGVLLVTFNNLDLEVWYSFLSATQKSGLRCTSVRYQVPAVVSAKSQFSPSGSYVGDFYCWFERDGDAAPGADEEVVAVNVRRTLRAHGPEVPIVLLHRVALLSILKHNLPASAIRSIERIIAGMTEQGAAKNRVREAATGIQVDLNEVPSIRAIVRQAVQRVLEHQNRVWGEVFKHILDETDPFGVPTEREALAWVEDLVFVRPDGTCELKASSPSQQPLDF